MRKPDFFIVGAPKCGTSSMYTYLQAHPEVFMAENKEPLFFATDMATGTYRDYMIGHPEKYLELFANAGDEKRIGEAQIWNLYSQTAAANIKDFNPSARIIIMLREPVDMLYSLHSQYIRSRHEDILDFERALDAEQDRKQGVRIPEKALGAKKLFYRDIIKYSEQIERYLTLFDRDKVHIIIYDDFVHDTLRVYRETCEFLLIDSKFKPDLKVINPNSNPRSKLLRDLLHYPPPIAVKLFRTYLPMRLRHHLKQQIKAISARNFKAEPRPPLAHETRQRLKAEFAPEIERLSVLLDRDLRLLWIEPEMKATDSGRFEGQLETPV